MVNVLLTTHQLQLTRKAVAEHIDSCRLYVSRINGHPMLPERAKAVAQVKAELNDLTLLSLVLLDAELSE